MVWQDACHINAVFWYQNCGIHNRPDLVGGTRFFGCASRPHELPKTPNLCSPFCVVDGMACTARAASAVPPELLCLETLEEMQVSEMSPKLSELAYAEGSTQRFNACGSPKEALARFSHLPVAVIARALYDGSPNPLLLSHPAPPSQSTRSWCVQLYTLRTPRKCHACATHMPIPMDDGMWYMHMHMCRSATPSSCSRPTCTTPRSRPRW